MKRSAAAWVVVQVLFPAAFMWGQGGFELTPMAGFRFGGNIDLVDPVLNPSFKKLEVESNPTYGVALNHGVHDNLQVEFEWNRQDTHINGRSRVTDTSSRLFGAYVDQYHLNLIFHRKQEGLRTQPFGTFGLGLTSFDARADLSGKTHLSYELGGGIKYFISPHLGLRFEAKWTPTYFTSNEQLFCNPSNHCSFFTNSSYLHQGQVSSGIIFRF